MEHHALVKGGWLRHGYDSHPPFARLLFGEVMTFMGKGSKVPRRGLAARDTNRAVRLVQLQLGRQHLMFGGEIPLATSSECTAGAKRPNGTRESLLVSWFKSSGSSHMISIKIAVRVAHF